MNGDRPSALKVQPPPVPAGSLPPEAFDVRAETKWTLTTKQLWRGAGLVAFAVLAVAALLPNLLPKTLTIATQSYVEAQDARQSDRMDAAEEHDLEQDEQIRLITVSIEGFGDGQNKARASAEAARVTQHIRNADRRVEEYERIRQACLRNLSAKPQREPLDGVAH